MPRFTTDGLFYFVSYVTGPAHVRLGLEWSARHVASVPLIRLPPVGSCEHGELSEPEITDAVTEGIAAANRRLGVTYHAARIAYISNDSPRYDLFRHCSLLLVQRHAAGLPFELSGS